MDVRRRLLQTSIIIKKQQKMTKIIILGENIGDQKPTKPIEFCFYLDACMGIVSTEGDSGKPDKWGNIELISEDYDGEHDLMFAWDECDGRSEGTLYIGHFNDGVV